MAPALEIILDTPACELLLAKLSGMVSLSRFRSESNSGKTGSRKRQYDSAEAAVCLSGLIQAG
jgi:hypothetical protein